MENHLQQEAKKLSKRRQTHRAHPGSTIHTGGGDDWNELEWQAKTCSEHQNVLLQLCSQSNPLHKAAQDRKVQGNSVCSACSRTCLCVSCSFTISILFPSLWGISNTYKKLKNGKHNSSLNYAAHSELCKSAALIDTHKYLPESSYASATKWLVSVSHCQIQLCSKSIEPWSKGNSFELQGILQDFSFPAYITVIPKQYCNACGTLWPENMQLLWSGKWLLKLVPVSSYVKISQVHVGQYWSSRFNLSCDCLLDDF